VSVKIESTSELWLIRHGETEWSASGRHTGRTDVPLTSQGEQQANRLRQRLQRQEFSLVLTSPLRRARDTCVLAGYGDRAVMDMNLREWDYGIYEGRTTAEIQAERPGWEPWTAAMPQGEAADEVGVRADLAISHAMSGSGKVALFAHAHLLRVLAARWLGWPAAAGRSLLLDTASVSVLGYEHGNRVIALWNDVSHLE
jgi:probable phosphoglycerate mutase